MPQAVVVLSGGQDSTTCLYWAKQRYTTIHAITFDYNQRHRVEIEAAEKVAALAGVASHEIIKLGPILKGRSPLTDHSRELETYTDHTQMESVIKDRIELTFVPMRNALFLTVAINRASCLEATSVITGVCEADNANYPDCRQSFIDSQAVTAHEALGIAKGSLVIETPLIHLTKPESINLALTLPGCYTALGYSHTAYSGVYPPTTKDHASVLRAWGFEESGVPDPLIVRAFLSGLMELPTTSNYNVVRQMSATGCTDIHTSLQTLESQLFRG